MLYKFSKVVLVFVMIPVSPVLNVVPHLKFAADWKKRKLVTAHFCTHFVPKQSWGRGLSENIAYAAIHEKN